MTMTFDKLATYLVGLFLLLFLLVFAYQGIVEQHLAYNSSKVNIRLDGDKAVFFGIANLLAAICLVFIFQSRHKRNDEL